jgi:hypothetical protein
MFAFGHPHVNADKSLFGPSGIRTLRAYPSRLDFDLSWLSLRPLRCCCPARAGDAEMSQPQTEVRERIQIDVSFWEGRDCSRVLTEFVDTLRIPAESMSWQLKCRALL